MGLKTSAGAIPSPFGFGGSYGPLYGVVAPMGRTVADVRLMFEAMVGRNPRDPHSVDVLDAVPPVRPRIAWSPRLGLGVAVDPDVSATVDAAVARLRAASWVIDAADITWPDGTSELAFSLITLAASAHMHGALWQREPALFGDNVAAMIERGMKVSGTEVATATRLADKVARAVASS